MTNQPRNPNSQNINQALPVVGFELLRLRFMMTCDTGWTGMIFRAGGFDWVAWENCEHIVDVRSAGA